MLQRGSPAACMHAHVVACTHECARGPCVPRRASRQIALGAAGAPHQVELNHFAQAVFEGDRARLAEAVALLTGPHTGFLGSCVGLQGARPTESQPRGHDGATRLSGMQLRAPRPASTKGGRKGEPLEHGVSKARGARARSAAGTIVSMTGTQTRLLALTLARTCGCDESREDHDHL